MSRTALPNNALAAAAYSPPSLYSASSLYRFTRRINTVQQDPLASTNCNKASSAVLLGASSPCSTLNISLPAWCINTLQLSYWNDALRRLSSEARAHQTRCSPTKKIVSLRPVFLAKAVGPLTGGVLIDAEYYSAYNADPYFVHNFPSPKVAPSVDTQNANANFWTPTYISNAVPYMLFIPKSSPWHGPLLGLLGVKRHNLPIEELEPGKWGLKPDIVKQWYDLEFKLSAVADALLERVPIRPPGFRPFGLPQRIGYMKRDFRTEDQARRVAWKSIDGFLPLLGQISMYILLHISAENTGGDAQWRTRVQKTANIHPSWWDLLEQSAAGDFQVPRIGGILDLRLPSNTSVPFCPLNLLFGYIIERKLPMPLYIRWGVLDGLPENLPQTFSDMLFFPDWREQEYLRSIPGPIKFSPWKGSMDPTGELTFTSLREEMPFVMPSSVSAAVPEPTFTLPFPPVEKHSGQRAGETMEAFLARRKVERENKIAKEDATQTQRRLQREANAKTGAVPGKKGARVYVWEISDGYYIRRAGGRSKYEEIWDDYSESQRLYDSTVDEWDVCEAFGTKDGVDSRPYTVDFDDDNNDDPWPMLPETGRTGRFSSPLSISSASIHQ
ncbi:hypothetical protein B0H19DRAFT_1250808 [Mycena capillaripes]|nr:hypothetical protein B0H19DRAFT_1250808 [Mycena capillaripes]